MARCKRWPSIASVLDWLVGEAEAVEASEDVAAMAKAEAYREVEQVLMAYMEQNPEPTKIYGGESVAHFER